MTTFGDKYRKTGVTTTQQKSTSFGSLYRKDSPTYTPPIITPIKTIEPEKVSVWSAIKGGISDLLRPTIEKVVPTYTAPTKHAYQKAEEFVSTLVEPTPLAQKIASGISMLTADVGILFTPITAVFTEAEKIPALKPAVEIITAPFTIGAITGGFIADRFVDALPVSQENKDILRPALKEAGETAGMIWLGGKAMEMIKRGKEITKKDIEKIKSEMPEKVKTAEIKPAEAPEIAKPTVEVTEPLAQEARKYKSAEEFVKNNDLIFQGVKDGKQSNFWSTNIEMARKYAGKDGKINVAKFGDMPEDLRLGLNKQEYTSAKNPIISADKARQPNIITTLDTKSQLTDIYNQATKGVEEVAPKTKPSGIAKSIEAKAIEEKLTRGYSDLAEYNPSTFPIEAQKMAELLESGIEKARAVVRGEVPTDIKAGAVISGMEEYAKTHPLEAPEIIRELANSQLATTISAGASETSFARMREQDSATIQLQEVKKAREEKASKITKQTKKEITKKLSDSTKKTEGISMEKLNSFIDSIIC